MCVRGTDTGCSIKSVMEFKMLGVVCLDFSVFPQRAEMLSYLKGCESFGCVLVTEASGSVNKGMYGVWLETSTGMISSPRY